MSPRVKKDIKSIKRRTQNKKNIKVMMNPRAKIKCHPESKKISKVLRDEPKIKKYQSDDEPKSQDQMSPQVKKDINGTIPQVKKNIKGMIPRVNKDIKVLREEPKIKKYQSDDEPKSQDQMS